MIASFFWFSRLYSYSALTFRRMPGGSGGGSVDVYEDDGASTQSVQTFEATCHCLTLLKVPFWRGCNHTAAVQQRDREL
jgi:hypothetical protein